MKVVFTAEMPTEDFITAVKEYDEQAANNYPDDTVRFMVERGMSVKCTKISLGLVADIIARNEIRDAIAGINNEAIPAAIKMALKDDVSD